MIGRSKQIAGRALVLSALSVIGFIAYVVHSHLNWASQSTMFLIAFYALLAGMLVFYMVSGTRWRSFAKLPAADGRVLVLVPSYNEEPELLRNTIEALLNQTRLPDEIHVIDDGSSTRVESFEHPLLTWHWQENQGKRHAQANVLRDLNPEDWDFILTVDSDSVCDADALEHLLRAMSEPKVQAATGMLLVRNWSDNFLTRLVDINVVTSCLMARMARSSIGAVCPTSGALALYRAEIVFDNLDDYTDSGTVGDDRRLSLYSLLRGEVVAVNEAVVETALPDTWKGTFKQRLRWSQSAWLAAPWVITNVRWPALLFYIYPLSFALMWPFVFAALVKLTITFGGLVIWYGVLFWLVVSLSETVIYAAYRPGFSKGERLVMWSLSLLLPILGFVILKPAMYWALAKIRNQAWGTREAQVYESTAV